MVRFSHETLDSVSAILVERSTAYTFQVHNESVEKVLGVTLLCNEKFSDS